MAEVFEERDLRDAIFWGVDLSGARLRDVNLTGVSVSHAFVIDVDIDAFVQRLTVNGVDVTEYVNERDEWYPLRGMVRPSDPEGMRTAWHALEQAWTVTIERALPLGEDKLHESVGGEWSFVQTLRHLVFATDKWFTTPILGEAEFHPFGVPNSGSVDFGWPGLDRGAQPTLDDVLAVRADRSARLSAYLDTLTAADLARQVDVLENGPSSVTECLHTVFEEEFQHNRYASRDLAVLESPSGP
jgi:hypothetical protein